MPPAAPKGKGLDLKRLPPWAWVLAIAGGAIVGFVLLRRPAREEESGEEPGAEGEGAPSRGGGGGGAPPRELLDAWGLTESYEAPMYGDSGGFDYGDSGGGGEATASLEQSLAGDPSSYFQSPTFYSPSSAGITLSSEPTTTSPSGGAGGQFIQAL